MIISTGAKKRQINKTQNSFFDKISENITNGYLVEKSLSQTQGQHN